MQSEYRSNKQNSSAAQRRAKTHAAHGLLADVSKRGFTAALWAILRVLESLVIIFQVTLDISMSRTTHHQPPKTVSPVHQLKMIQQRHGKRFGEQALASSLRRDGKRPDANRSRRLFRDRTCKCSTKLLRILQAGN